MMFTETGSIVVGVVSQLDDKTLGRVKVKFPHLKGTESEWCPIVTPMGGPDRGFMFMPEVGDHVLIALEQCDPNRGYVLGAIWSKQQPPPKGDGEPKKNNRRFIRSRSGHEIRLDDTKGKERIEIIDKDVKRKIVIDCSGKKVQVQCDDGDVEVHAGTGNVTIRAPRGTVQVEAQSLQMKASGSASIEASGSLTLKGSMVNIN